MWKVQSHTCLTGRRLPFTFGLEKWKPKNYGTAVEKQTQQNLPAVLTHFSTGSGRPLWKLVRIRAMVVSVLPWETQRWVRVRTFGDVLSLTDAQRADFFSPACVCNSPVPCRPPIFPLALSPGFLCKRNRWGRCGTDHLFFPKRVAAKIYSLVRTSRTAPASGEAWVVWQQPAARGRLWVNRSAWKRDFWTSGFSFNMWCPKIFSSFPMKFHSNLKNCFW